MPGAVNNATKKAEIQNQITKVWTQIANYFKNYGDYLIFETLNEVHNGNWGNGWGTAYEHEQDILFDWNQAALSAIRATGGNNATRFVAVPGLGATEPPIVVAAHNRDKLLPDDEANGTSKLIVAVHYYAPSPYTVAGITDLENPLIHTWGDPSEKHSLEEEMELLKTNFINNGIPVYLGEWGAPTNVRSSMSQTIKNTHLDYIRSVATAARQNGVIPINWDDGGDFKMLERSNGKPKAGLWKDVLDAMMTAINSPVPNNITGNMGQYKFGLEADNVTTNYAQAVWSLAEPNLTIAKQPGAKLKLVLNTNTDPTGNLDLVWQGPANGLYWQDGNVLDASSTTWDPMTKALTIDLSEAIDDYDGFIDQSSLNIIISYGDNVNDLGIVSADILGSGEVIGGDIVIGSYTWNAFNDVDNGGTSSITIREWGTGEVKVSGYVTNTYEYGFAGWVAVPDATELEVLKTATSISFRVLGNGKTYKIMLPTSNITDDSYYVKTFGTGYDYENITINISDLVSPGWGQSNGGTAFDQSLVERIQWQTDDLPGGLGEFTFIISDLQLH